MDEQIVFCKEDGTPTGEFGPKLESHHAHTKLHSAFSCYVFNDSGQLLVTQRALSKKVWPGVWTNSVCGHPAPGEERITAVRRRLEYELGMQAVDFQIVLPDYRYVTPPYNGIVENEYCPVYVARAVSDPVPNKEEVEDWKWMAWEDFVRAIESDSDDYSIYADQGVKLAVTDGPVYSWWCKDQVKRLKDQPLVMQYRQPISS